MKFSQKTACVFLSLMGMFLAIPSAHAAERLTITCIAASNNGHDFDIDNDAYRDQIMRLFAYKSYDQLGLAAVNLEPGVASEMKIPGDYDLYLKLISVENHQDRVHVLIKKGGMEYVDTILTLTKPGVVFLGGPKMDEGDLIIVLEMGF